MCFENELILMDIHQKIKILINVHQVNRQEVNELIRAYRIVNRNEVATTLLNNGNVPDEDGSLDRTLTLNDEAQLKKDYAELKV